MIVIWSIWTPCKKWPIELVTNHPFHTAGYPGRKVIVLHQGGWYGLRMLWFRPEGNGRAGRWRHHRRCGCSGWFFRITAKLRYSLSYLDSPQLTRSCEVSLLLIRVRNMYPNCNLHTKQRNWGNLFTWASF